MLILEEFLAFR